MTDLDVTGSGMVDGAYAFSETTRSSIRVKVDGLSRVTAPWLAVAQGSTHHGLNNGYATVAMQDALGEMASAFAAALEAIRFPVPQIRVTALSLPFGGLFDYENEWSPPHSSHRFGTDADLGLRELNSVQKQSLKWAISKAGLRTPVRSESPADPSANHWHVCP